jgi:hypothetical protein
MFFACKWMEDGTGDHQVKEIMLGSEGQIPHFPLIYMENRLKR